MGRMTTRQIENYGAQVKTLLATQLRTLAGRVVTLRLGKATVRGRLEETLLGRGLREFFRRHGAVDRRMTIRNRRHGIDDAVASYAQLVDEARVACGLPAILPLLAAFTSAGSKVAMLEACEQELCDHVAREARTIAVELAQQAGSPEAAAWAALAPRNLDRLADDIAHAVSFPADAKAYLATLHGVLVAAGIPSPLPPVLLAAIGPPAEIAA